MRKSSRRKQSKLVAGMIGSTLALPPLSPAATEFVQQHPEQASIAVAAALEAAAALSLNEPEVPASLRPFIVEAKATPDLIGVEEAAKRLDVTRATIYNWIDAKRLLGWRLTQQGTMIPAEQILGPGEVVAGIDRVLDLIPGPRAAWRFLSEESPFFDEPQRPIDVLRAGKIDAAVSAARASGEAFS